MYKEAKNVVEINVEQGDDNAIVYNGSDNVRESKVAVG